MIEEIIVKVDVEEIKGKLEKAKADARKASLIFWLLLLINVVLYIYNAKNGNTEYNKSIGYILLDLAVWISLFISIAIQSVVEEKKAVLKVLGRGE